MDDKETKEIKEKLRTLEENPFGVHFDPIKTLKDALHNSNVEVLRHAAKLVGSFPNSDFIEPLFRIVAESVELEVRQAALESLGTFLHQARMADYHRESESEWELESEEQMSELSPEQYDAISEFMRKLVAQETWPSSLRSEALTYLARIDPESAATRVDQFYRSNDQKLKEGAVKALRSLESKDWEKMILQELSRTQRDDRHQYAIEAAGVHKIADAGPRLLDILEESRDQEIREKAAEALSLIPWAKAGEHLQRFTDDRNPVVRSHAQNGLIRQHSNLEDTDIADLTNEQAPEEPDVRPGGLNNFS